MRVRVRLVLISIERANRLTMRIRQPSRAKNVLTLSLKVCIVFFLVVGCLYWLIGVPPGRPKNASIQVRRKYGRGLRFVWCFLVRFFCTPPSPHGAVFIPAHLPGMLAPGITAFLHAPISAFPYVFQPPTLTCPVSPHVCTVFVLLVFRMSSVVVSTSCRLSA